MDEGSSLKTVRASVRADTLLYVLDELGTVFIPLADVEKLQCKIYG